MGVNRMTGTPWHVETLGTGEGKQRHRSHCSHFIYETKQCSYGGRCFGSAHCDYYEKMSKEEEREKRAQAKKKSERIPKIPKKYQKDNKPTIKSSEHFEVPRKPDGSCPIPVGAIAKSKDYKQGRVIKVEGNNLTISFDSGIVKTVYPQCLSSIVFIIKETK